MSLGEDFDRIDARLRRCARALVAASPAANPAADRLAEHALRRFHELSPSSSQRRREVEAYALLVESSRTEPRLAAPGAPCAPGAFGPGSTAQSHDADKAMAEPALTALASLRPEEREALLLVVLEGFSYDEAAQILKISPQILVVRLLRARERLPTRLPERRGSRSAAHLRLVK
ncbi:RNA polymerase sigma factor [Methylocella sp.]|uniref:RNA polymerase sigma factor n=1 Tax=Methylocella sp. TaxID=1978226 RepID=UPI003782F3FF